MKTIRYMLVVLIAIQLILPYAMPLRTVYHHRMDYELTKNNLGNIDTVLEQIQLLIRKENLDDYLILLGDSVFYGSPGPSTQAVNVFMEQKWNADQPDQKRRVFNLALPAMQLGDIYTMLLKLDQHHIATEHVIINVRYSSFAPRTPYPPAVFWLKEDLRLLDAEAFRHVLPQLQATGYIEIKGWVERTKGWLRREERALTPIAYKDFIRKGLNEIGLTLTNQALPDDAIGDPRPWTEKEGLDEYVRSDAMKSSYPNTSFDLTENSYDIYFLNRILQHQKGTHTGIVRTGSNHELLNAYLTQPIYTANEKALDAFLSHQSVPYFSFEGLIPDKLFSDHTHFTPEGYQQLAELLVSFDEEEVVR